MKRPHWKRLRSTYLIDSTYLKIRRDEIELPDGSVLPDYYIREARGFAIVIARTTTQRFLAIEQYRYASDDVGVEFVAGSLEEAEDPLHCARRELREESGYEAPDWRLLAEFRPDPVRSTSTAYLYFADRAVRAGEPALEPTEQIEAVELTLEELFAAVRDGRMHAGPSLAAFACGLTHGVF